LKALGALAVPAIIATAAFAAIVPMFWLGIPSGHDFEFHVNSWMEVARQWQQGTFYPRWAAMANYGYGEPRFIFYPPASWMFGAGLGTVFPWALVPGIYIWAVLTAAGCSMFALARRWLPRQHAAFVAVLYAVNPYHLVIVYWRSAFAEMMAGIGLPLLLLFVLRLARDASDSRKARRAMVCLALVVAAVWLTNLPAAVMVNYSLVLLVGVAALMRRSIRVLLYGAGACALGLALAGFYVLPVAYEKQWVHISGVLSLGVNPQSNFLFTVIADPEHNLFNFLVSFVAILEIGVLSVAVLLSRRRRSKHPDLWWTVTVWGGTAALLMFPFTLILWKYFPELRFVQLPWRWLLCLNAALALLMGIGVRRWLSRALIYVAMLVTLAAVWHWMQPPWWDKGADLEEMSDNLEKGVGYESVEEYVPTRGDVEAVQRDAPDVVVEGGAGQIQIDDWTPESKSFTAVVTRPSRLLLHLFDYPGWKAEVNGHPITAETLAATGQTVIPVPPGTNSVHVIFSRTWDRTAGAIASGITLLLMVLLFVLPGKRALVNNGGG
jgi:hypothetical protein